MRLTIARTLVNLSVGPIAFHVTPGELLGCSSTVINFTLTLTAMLASTLVGWLNSVVLHHFHAVVLNIYTNWCDYSGLWLRQALALSILNTSAFHVAHP